MTKKYASIHDLKLDDIEDLVEELNGTPLLVAYEFQSDFERLRERFGVEDKATGRKILPYLGKGTSASDEAKWIRQWNNGELPIMAAHPASAGHGLNLQEGHAKHIYWFGITWDLELYDQFIRRLKRSGNDATRIFNHQGIVRGTIDELKLEALSDKDITQSRLLRGLNAEILREGAETQAGREMPDFVERKMPMVGKLSRQEPGSAPVAQQHQEQGQTAVAPKGWGGRSAAPAREAEAPPPEQDQRDRIQNQIAPQDRVSEARGAFSPAVQQHMQELEQEDTNKAPPPPGRVTEAGAPSAAPKTPRTRRAAAEPEPATMGYNEPQLRAECLKVAFGNPETSYDDGMELAREFFSWVLNGDG